jgi:hypothetical protein
VIAWVETPTNPLLSIADVGLVAEIARSAGALLGFRSGSVVPGQAVAGMSDSTASDATAIYGEMASTSPGGSSAAVRGQNNGTGDLGIGVYGSQAGSGWGVYGTAASGIGVLGDGGSGTGASDGGWASTGSAEMRSSRPPAFMHRHA